MSTHGLSNNELEQIKGVLAPYRTQIETIGLFGSRATGCYRPNSNIDLVIYGNLDEKALGNIYTRFEESSLPVHVDVQIYELIAYPPLKKHIDEVIKPLILEDI